MGPFGFSGSVPWHWALNKFFYFFLPDFKDIFPVSKIIQFALKMKKLKKCAQKGEPPWVGFVAGGAACISHLELHLSSCQLLLPFYTLFCLVHTRFYLTTE